jgi:pyruvate formate lyase activating enzyme
VTDTPSNNDPTGLVFDIQHYSLDDGPGIRTTVFMKGCPLSCQWCQNPESINPDPQVGFRGERCIGCGKCHEVCPRDAIALESDYRIDLSRCDACGKCAEACPTRALFPIGRTYTVSELLEEVSRDAAFYEESGGGVTLSGGEPTLQFEFTLAFLEACKQASLDTAIETNGFASQEKLAALMPYLDHIYFDLKIISPEDHKRLTAADNKQILENARFLIESEAPVHFRVPLISSMTATEDNVDAIGMFLNEMEVRELELCPYHENWITKLSWLGRREFPPPELLSHLSEEELLEVIRAFYRQGIIAQVKPSAVTVA